MSQPDCAQVSRAPEKSVYMWICPVNKHHWPIYTERAVNSVIMDSGQTTFIANLTCNYNTHLYTLSRIFYRMGISLGWLCILPFPDISIVTLHDDNHESPWKYSTPLSINNHVLIHPRNAFFPSRMALWGWIKFANDALRLRLWCCQRCCGGQTTRLKYVSSY